MNGFVRLATAAQIASTRVGIVCNMEGTPLKAAATIAEWCKITIGDGVYGKHFAC